MNRLSRTDRARIIALLLEGMSMRAISRITGASINTVTRLLVDAGKACAEFHDTAVRDVQSKRVQVDEIWSFTYAKQANVEKAKAAPDSAGDTWTWTAIDADSKLVISWHIGPRDAGSAYTVIADLSARLANRVQLTTDGLSLYVDAVEDAFGADVDYAQLVKIYGQQDKTESYYSTPPKCIAAKKQKVMGQPDIAHVSTSYVERHNLSMRMHMRRFTRLTNAFSKRVQNHLYHVALYTVWFNYCRIHKTLKVTPAMAAGLSDTLRDVDWIVELVEARDPKPGPRGPYKKRQTAVSN